MSKMYKICMVYIIGILSCGVVDGVCINGSTFGSDDTNECKALQDAYNALKSYGFTQPNTVIEYAYFTDKCGGLTEVVSSDGNGKVDLNDRIWVHVGSSGYCFTPSGDIMNVAAAHEMTHVYQLSGYDIYHNSTDESDLACCFDWWTEATAVWMEDKVHPNVNDYRKSRHMSST